MVSRNECTIEVKLVHDALISITDKYFARMGLTFSQIRYLGFLSHQNHPVALKQLESTFKVSQPTVAGMVKRLQEKDLVIISRDPSDYKSKNVRLSQNGREMYSLISSERKHLLESMYAGFSQQQLDELYMLLAKLYHNMTNETSMMDLKNH